MKRAFWRRRGEIPRENKNKRHSISLSDELIVKTQLWKLKMGACDWLVVNAE
jgi:hypothetical protein